MKPDAQRSKWNPGFEYLNDPEISKLQNFMDDSLFYLDNNLEDKEKRETALSNFKSGMEKMLASLPKFAKSNPIRLKMVLLFVRKNLKDLDLGGLSSGRSHQNNILVEANKHFFENYREFWDEVTSKEKRV